MTTALLSREHIVDNQDAAVGQGYGLDGCRRQPTPRSIATDRKEKTIHPHHQEWSAMCLLQ